MLASSVDRSILSAPRTKSVMMSQVALVSPVSVRALKSKMSLPAPPVRVSLPNPPVNTLAAASPFSVSA
ncbi:hypothetical protein D3C86_1231170 [compost metagenome]